MSQRADALADHIAQLGGHIETLNERVERLERERDDARDAAGVLYRLQWPEGAPEWEKEYPWLKEP